MRIKLKALLCLFMLIVTVNSLFAQDNTTENIVKNEGETTLKEIIVKGKKSTISNKMVITENVKDKITVGDPKNVMDLLNNISIIDFRGPSDIGPTGLVTGGNYFIRGFSGWRFTSAIDGVAQYSTPLSQGGRAGNLNYDFIPTWLIESVEIIPGPHSALYLGKSLGGVINFKTATPKVYDTLKPDIGLSTSYSSYNSQNYNANMSGSINHITYDLGCQYYTSDGYLRNSTSSLQNLFGRIGYAFDNGGFIALTIADSDSDYDIPVYNYKGISADSSAATYNSDDPTVTTARYYDWQNPEREESYHKYSADMELPSMIGTLSGGVYKTKDTRHQTYLTKATDTTDTIMDTTIRTRGGRIQDEIKFNENHKTTIAYDLTAHYADYESRGGSDDEKRAEINGSALEHEWRILPSLTLTLGARYEHVRVNMWNHATKPVAGYGDIIPKSWDGIAPKSILKYDMDELTSWLRDTSLMVGVSRIWHAPDKYYNRQNVPTSIYTDAEHGIAYDLIFMRRLFSDFHINMGYSFMRINDYIAINSDFSEYAPASTVDQSLLYKDYLLNCETMDRHGIDIAFKGDINKNLNLSLSYSYQKFINQGDEPAGEQAASDKAKHKVKAAVRYQLIPNLFVNADYFFQSRQVQTTCEEIDTDVYEETRTEIDPYHLVNMGIAYKFIDSMLGLKNATFKIYVNNLFNEEYENAKGYPMTDQTFGVSLSINI